MHSFCSVQRVLVNVYSGVPTLQSPFRYPKTFLLAPLRSGLVPTSCPGNHGLSFSWYSCTFSRISNEWHHIRYSLLRLASFTWRGGFEIPPWMVFHCSDTLPPLELGCPPPPHPTALAIRNDADTHICIQGLVWGYVCILLSIPWNAIAGSYSKSMCNFSRNYQNGLKVAAPFCIGTLNEWVCVCTIYESSSCSIPHQHMVLLFL